MQFSEIIGLQGIKKQLIANVNDGRISHAQLFIGNEGSGHLPLALAFVQYLFCEQKQSDDSCGKCRSCMQISKLSHPDVHFTFPFFPKKEEHCDNYMSEFRAAFSANPYLDTSEWYKSLDAENRQGNINKNEAANILHKLNLKTYEGGYKVSIIWCPELLHPSAANALLKILEEPPVKTLFLLVASKYDEILPTILSRTQLVKVPRLSVEELANALVERLDAEKSLADSIAGMSDGNYLEAKRQLSFSDTDEAFLFLQFRHWMRICFKPKENMVTLQDWVEDMAKVGREMQKQFLQYCLFIARQCVMKNYLGNQQLSVRGEELDFINKFSPFFNERNIVAFTNCFNEAHRDISRNANPKILFLDLSFKAFVLIKK